MIIILFLKKKIGWDCSHPYAFLFSNFFLNVVQSVRNWSCAPPKVVDMPPWSLASALLLEPSHTLWPPCCYTLSWWPLHHPLLHLQPLHCLLHNWGLNVAPYAIATSAQAMAADGGEGEGHRFPKMLGNYDTFAMAAMKLKTMAASLLHRCCLCYHFTTLAPLSMQWWPFCRHYLLLLFCNKVTTTL